MNMARRTWSQDDTRALIDIYEKNPILWNTKYDEYRNRDLKNEVITKIALECKCTAGEIQRKLHNLRNQVSQELNKIKKKKSGSGTDEVYTSTWPYFSALKFLIPGLINRSTTSNIGDEEDAHGDVSNEGLKETENNMDKEMKRIITPETVEKKGSKRKCAFDDDNSKVLKRALEIMQKEPDENGRFGDYVAMELKSLRFDANRRRLKSEIRRAIARIADEDDLHNSSSVSTVPSHYPSPLHYPAQPPSPYLSSSPSPSPSSMIYQQPPGSCTYNKTQQYDQATSIANRTCDIEIGIFQ